MIRFFDILFTKSKIENAASELRDVVDKAISANQISVKSCDDLWHSVANFKRCKIRANVK